MLAINVNKCHSWSKFAAAITVLSSLDYFNFKVALLTPLASICAIVTQSYKGTMGKKPKVAHGRTHCKYSALFWNPFGTRGFTGLWIISAKLLILVVSRTGFEPVTHWLKVSCSTNWANGPLNSYLGTAERLVNPENENNRCITGFIWFGSVYAAYGLKKHT